MKKDGVVPFYIELIEGYPCENWERLREREGHSIREFGTLNKKVEGRTPNEYRKDNYESISKWEKDYREVNREAHLARAR